MSVRSLTTSEVISAISLAVSLIVAYFQFQDWRSKQELIGIEHRTSQALITPVAPDGLRKLVARFEVALSNRGSLDVNLYDCQYYGDGTLPFSSGEGGTGAVPCRFVNRPSNLAREPLELKSGTLQLHTLELEVPLTPARVRYAKRVLLSRAGLIDLTMAADLERAGLNSKDDRDLSYYEKQIDRDSSFKFLTFRVRSARGNVFEKSFTNDIFSKFPWKSPQD
jgi:hypothetical protein